MSFTAEPGQTIALVGHSGAGKTTLASLIPRLYDVTTGAVRIDGHDVRDVTRQSVAEAVGIVSQDPHLFHDTIAANLRFARPSATDAEIVDACRRARIHDLIVSLPDGFDTVVGERGLRLSGGEKQRIAIARVLLKRPAVVILDEATAHLDSENEAQCRTRCGRLSPTAPRSSSPTGFRPCSRRSDPRARGRPRRRAGHPLVSSPRTVSMRRSSRPSSAARPSAQPSRCVPSRTPPDRPPSRPASGRACGLLAAALIGRLLAAGGVIGWCWGVLVLGAPLVVHQVEEPGDGENAEEPPLQSVEEVGAVVELGEVGLAELGRSGARGGRLGGGLGGLGVEVEPAGQERLVDNLRDLGRGERAGGVIAVDPGDVGGVAGAARGPSR